MTKRLCAGFLALVLMALLAACGAKEVPTVSDSDSASAPESQPVDSIPQPAGRQPLPLAVGFSALTGLPTAEDFPEGQRPVAIMVSNNQRSLPQRGLGYADVIYEMLTEGGITRLMALYTDYRQVPLIGPVRSTRDQFLQFVLPSSAIPVHIGTSVYAQNLLTVMNYAEINGLYLGTTAFWFDEQRTLPKLEGGKLNEYCWFSSGSAIQDAINHLGLPTTGEVRSLFNFAEKEAAPATDAMAVQVVYSDISVVGFNYNAEDGLYYKTIFGGQHMDEDGTPLRFKNLLLLDCSIGLKPDGLCTEFDLTRGTGHYFTAGGVTPIQWIKGGPADALRIFDMEGNELEVQKGTSYIGLPPIERADAVTWLSADEVAAQAG